MSTLDAVQINFLPKKWENDEGFSLRVSLKMSEVEEEEKSRREGRKNIRLSSPPFHLISSPLLIFHLPLYNI